MVLYIMLCNEMFKAVEAIIVIFPHQDTKATLSTLIDAIYITLLHLDG